MPHMTAALVPFSSMSRDSSLNALTHYLPTIPFPSNAQENSLCTFAPGSQYATKPWRSGVVSRHRIVSARLDLGSHDIWKARAVCTMS